MSRQVLVLCLALALGCKNTNDELQRQRDEAVKAKEAAEQTAAQAVKDSREAIDKVDKLERELEDLTRRLDEAFQGLASAQNDADRSSAKARLEQLQKERADMMNRAAAAKDAAKKAGK